MTSSQWMLSLSPLQKTAGISFILAKITSIAAIPLIFASAVDEGYLSLSKWMIGMACFLLGVSIVSCIVSMSRDNNNTKEEKIDELLNDPETKRLIERKLKCSKTQ